MATKLSLYVDTSYQCDVGLLDESFNWIHFIQSEEKPSLVLHKQINECLERKNVKLPELDHYFLVKGPGSYTGLRFVEGISQFLDWNNKKVYGFYHFDLLNLDSKEKKGWVSNAFKNQFFLYVENEENNLYDKNEVAEKIESYQKQGYTFYTRDEKIRNDDQSILNFESYFGDQRKECFEYVMKTIKNKDIFYYRSLEEEFKK